MESYLTFILCGGLFFIVVMMFIGWSAISHANGVEMNVVERRATMTQNGGPTVSNLVDTMQLLIDESDATAAREASDGVLIGFLIGIIATICDLAALLSVMMLDWFCSGKYRSQIIRLTLKFH
jgi:hypothetical protein